ncbi:Zinc finger BED domain-containing protein [Canna indica]|uniref:Zinc finger BED domain-containing protein n=1 Tax=Canna indica TaxID=4628 RepID=A0AAQ3QPE5_9LILI|nr:Zinc finger BED domain-containing protein [Canna indica]
MDNWRPAFTLFVNEKSTYMCMKSELDNYLEEKVLPPNSDEEFDILAWWKSNGLKYPTLQKIARDFLTIPISIVASESAFSISASSKMRLGMEIPSMLEDNDVDDENA